jgi:hypothetical protein
MNASKNIFVVAENILFDFELFIGELTQKNKELINSFEMPAL